VDGTTNVSSATSVSFDAADGNMTLTGATTATDATSLTVSATDDFEQTGNFVSDANIDVNLTAAGSSASVRFNGVLDVDHLQTLTMTASGGGAVTVDDIETLGVDADGDNHALNIVIDASGEDSSANASTVTVSAFAVAADTTVDSVVITGDADGEVSFTTGNMADTVDLVFTEIDASDFAGTLTINTATAVNAGSGTAEDTTITLETGSGTNTITTEELVSDTITLAASAGTDTIRIDLDNDGTSAADTVSNFEAGADGDVISLDVSGIGDTTGNMVVNGAGTDLSSGLVVTIQDDADGTLTLAASTNIIRLTNTFANLAAVDTALTDLVTSAETGLSDNDNLLVLWTNGANTYLSRVQINDAAPDTDGNAGDGTIEAFDEEEDLLILEGVTVTSLTAANFAFR
jgi:hypothetical protein